MDELTRLIKTEIKKQFRSVRQFSMYIGVPQSTIVTALQKGVGGTSFETIMHMCDVLDIKPVADAIAPLEVLNATSVAEMKTQLAEAKDKIDTARKALVK